MSIASFDELEQVIKKNSVNNKKSIAIMCADDDEVLFAISDIVKRNIAEAFLVGNTDNMKKIAEEHNIDLTGMELIEENDIQKIGEICTELVNSGKASTMMKGLVGSADFLRAVLNKEKGLRTGSVLSHVAVFELPTYPKFLTVTDAAVNISPTLQNKASIIKNTANMVKAFGVKKPKVAAICAVEKVNAEKMPATADAAALSNMAKNGELGEVFVDGPFAFDVAVSKHAAKIKKLDHLDASGDADIILADDIESGNMVYKTLANFGQGKSGAVVVGAKVPLVLTSRSDTHETKYNSILLALL